MQKLNQKGVAAVVILVLILFLGVVGLAGWRIWDSKKTKENKSAQSLNQMANSSKISKETDPYEGWLTYTNSKYGYEFRYPTNKWTTVESSGENSSPSIQSTDPAPVQGGVGPGHFLEGAKLVVAVRDAESATTPEEYLLLPKNEFTNRVITERSSTSIEDKKALHYRLHYEGSPTETTLVVNHGKAYFISITYAKPDDVSYETALSKYKNDYEQFVNSFKFTN